MTSAVCSRDEILSKKCFLLMDPVAMDEMWMHEREKCEKWVKTTFCFCEQVGSGAAFDGIVKNLNAMEPEQKDILSFIDSAVAKLSLSSDDDRSSSCASKTSFDSKCHLVAKEILIEQLFVSKTVLQESGGVQTVIEINSATGLSVNQFHNAVVEIVTAQNVLNRLSRWGQMLDLDAMTFVCPGTEATWKNLDEIKHVQPVCALLIERVMTIFSKPLHIWNHGTMSLAVPGLSSQRNLIDRILCTQMDKDTPPRSAGLVSRVLGGIEVKVSDASVCNDGANSQSKWYLSGFVAAKHDRDNLRCVITTNCNTWEFAFAKSFDVETRTLFALTRLTHDPAATTALLWLTASLLL
jgi:hypothetical protein